MSQIRRQLLRLTLAVIVTLLPSTAWSQPYPSRPITIIVPFAAGGPLDVVARILSERMRVTLGQPLLIENVTGAMGTMASAVQCVPHQTAIRSLWDSGARTF
jgi:tripartite-type tricarboxylate transporter receptor subunit TctC